MTLEKQYKKDGITYYYSITSKQVEVGEYGDNPHGTNSTATCTLDEFIHATENGNRCQSIIRANFGQGVLNEILMTLQGGK